MFHYAQPGDVVVYGGVEIPADVLAVIVHPTARVLWAFIQEHGRVRPVAYDETRVIWLLPEDLTREDAAEKET